ncbi:MAG: NUDIX hydrolase [Chloroflexi bacterium]|nr:NUDIX hydrolase [Chloroflexota bacterium]
MAGAETTSEYSAGGVVYRQVDQGYEIVIVQRARHDDWSLPKGHIEAGESREQAAVREVREETGLDAHILLPIDEVVYFYRRPKEGLTRKTVYHYLMRADNYLLGGPNWEVSEVRWIPIDQASSLLTYRKDKEIVSKAEVLLKTRN